MLRRKQVRGSGLSLEDAVEEALCFGWIDGKLRRLNEREYALRFSPRKPKSAWAASNKARVAKLMREGRMAPAGSAAVAAAKESGAWETLDDPAQYDAVPPDLEAALSREPGAAQRFAAFTAAQRRDYIRWVETAVRAETRARRVAEVARRAAAGIKPGMPG